jgi:hypothetical protein
MPKTIKTNDVEAVTLTEEQKARLKGQSGMSGQGVRLPVVDRILLNGNCDAIEDVNGNLVRPPIAYRLMKLSSAEKDKKPTYEALGAPIEVVFVKIRRRLVARDRTGFQIMSSTQHGNKDQIVTLWREGKCIATGKASELREQYPELRTIQEVYVLREGNLEMLIVKGAALGSETRDKGLPSFYQYLQSIASDGIFAHTTVLNGVKESGKKDFYTMTFAKGRATTPTEQLSVLEHSDMLSEIIEKYDADNKTEKDRTEVEKANASEAYDKFKGPSDGFEYPKDEVPVELPFE